MTLHHLLLARAQCPTASCYAAARVAVLYWLPGTQGSAVLGLLTHVMAPPGPFPAWPLEVPLKWT